MKKVMKIFVAALTGIGIGSLIECVLTVFYGSLIIGTPQFMAAHESVVFVRVVQTILYAGFGVVSELASSLYDRDGESLLKRTTVHIVVIFLYFLATGWYLKWFTNLYAVLASVAIFFVIYALIWILIYRSKKREIDAVNEKLKKLER